MSGETAEILRLEKHMLIQDILVNIIASIILLVLGYYSRTLIFRFKIRHLYALWGPLIKSKAKIKVALTTTSQPGMASGARVSLNELTAFAELSSVIKQFDKELSFIENEDSAVIQSLEAYNLVILGGPRQNKAAAQVWSMIQNRFPVRVDSARSTIIVGGQEYQSVTEDSTGNLLVDYGILFRVRSPFMANRDNDKFIIGAFGLHDFGTHGAIRASLQDDLTSRLTHVVKSPEFIAIIQVKLRESRIVDTSIAECFILTGK